MHANPEIEPGKSTGPQRVSRGILFIAILALQACTSTPDLPQSELNQPTIEYGRPDLIIPMFIPPVLYNKSGATIYITERTSNVGIASAGESVTRYYVSDTSPVDITTAAVIGQRTVNSMPGRESDSSDRLTFTIPDGFEEEGYLYLAACVDDDHQVNEAIEDNNCSFHNQQDGGMVVFSSGVFVPEKQE